MDLTISVLLFVTAFFCLATGITAAASSWMPPWSAGTVTRPRLWGAGFTLFGAAVLYHAVIGLVDVDATVEMAATTVTTLMIFAGAGLMWFAQRVCQRARSPRTGPDISK